MVSEDGRTLEGGCSPGQDVPVFDCDFGKLGIQICYDMEFDYGWNELASKGAELIAWPTQSPQTSQPAFRAMQNRCYIISSTWRNNASVFEPTGKIPAQTLSPDSTLVHQLDLSYAILPWQPKLQKGEALRKKYGDKVGFRYYEDEDCGIFWSNDPQFPLPKWRVLSAFSRRSRCSSEFDRSTTTRRCADTEYQQCSIRDIGPAYECTEWYARCDFLLRSLDQPLCTDRIDDHFWPQCSARRQGSRLPLRNTGSR